MTLHDFIRAGTTGLVVVATAVGPIHAQTDGTCVPVLERAGREIGCFITARDVLGPISTKAPLYWHLDTFSTLAGAQAARGPRGTVVESLGRIWLFTIETAGYRPSGGTRIARVGPLPLVKAEQFAAVYMEVVFDPGMASVVHRHPGVEAWHTIAGSMCVETPNGRLVQRAGGKDAMIAGDIPMTVTAAGAKPSRSVVLILQDATLPRSTPAPEWTPLGLCRTATGAR